MREQPIDIPARPLGLLLLHDGGLGEGELGVVDVDEVDPGGGEGGGDEGGVGRAGEEVDLAGEAVEPLGGGLGDDAVGGGDVAGVEERARAAAARRPMWPIFSPRALSTRMALASWGCGAPDEADALAAGDGSAALVVLEADGVGDDEAQEVGLVVVVLAAAAAGGGGHGREGRVWVGLGGGGWGGFESNGGKSSGRR